MGTPMDFLRGKIRGDVSLKVLPKEINELVQWQKPVFSIQKPQQTS